MDWKNEVKVEDGGRAETDNVKYAKSDFFNFNSATTDTFELFVPLHTLFPYMDPW